MKIVTIEDLIEVVEQNLPTLNRDQSYTLEQLVGKKLWQSIPTTHRKQLGAEFKERALKGLLPVYWHDRRSDNIQVYRLN